MYLELTKCEKPYAGSVKNSCLFEAAEEKIGGCVNGSKMGLYVHRR